MLTSSIKRTLAIIGFLIVHCSPFAQTALADVTIETEPTTNSSGNNGKITITVDLGSAVPPFVISITGPVPFAFTGTTSNSVTTLDNLRFGNYSGTIVDNNGCIATIETHIEKCKFVPLIGSSAPSVICEMPTEPGPDGSVSMLYVTGTVNTFSGTIPENFTFQAFHSLPSYLYDQIVFSLFQTMTFEIKKLAQLDYSEFEIFEQYEFQSDAPYIFSFSADGFLVWVFRNLNSSGYDAAMARSEDDVPQQTRRLFPNPTTGIVHIPIEKQTEESKVLCKVFTNFGQSVLIATIDVAAGTNNISINLDSTAAGLYFIRVSNQNGNSDVYSVIKF